MLESKYITKQFDKKFMNDVYINYGPVLVFIFVAFGLSGLLMLLSWLRGKAQPYKNKNLPYECGFDAFDVPEKNTDHKFQIHFYLVAILFIIFDLEIALLFPWATSFKQIGVVGFYAMVVFLMVLTLGFIYEWRKGVLDWE